MRNAITCLIFIMSVFAGDISANQGFSDEPVEQIIHPSWFKQSFLDLSEDAEDANTDGKTGIIVYYGQEHCPYCNALMTINFGDKDISDYTQKHFDVIALDIYGNREVVDFSGQTLSEQAYSLQQKAQVTPILDFYNGTQRVFRLRGYYPPDKFFQALKYVAEKKYETLSFRDYLTSAEDIAKISPVYKDDEDLFESPPYILQRSEHTDRPLLVLFESGDCKECIELHKTVFQQSSVKKLLARFDAVQLDMWSATPVITPAGDKITAVEWAENLGLFYSPTLVFFDEAGTEIFRVDSLVKIRRLQNVLEYLISEDYLEEPNYEAWRKARLEMKE